MANPRNFIFPVFFFFVFLLLHLASSSPDYDGDVCNPKRLPPPHLLHPTKLTVLISGFSETRLPLLRSLAIAYSSHPLVSSVQILWSNPSTPPATLSRALHPFPTLRSPSASLNTRFLPRPSVLTRATAIADDDVQVPPDALSFALSIFNTDPRRVVGFFPRSHDLDLSRREWIYTVHPDRYSMVLTKFMILHAGYLHEYSCGGGPRMREMRAAVDRVQNCEDILMNFVVAEKAGVGPLLVDGGGVRDWGDVRNDEEGALTEGTNETRRSNGSGGGSEEDRRGLKVMKEVGLSKREGHWRTRGECITEFHRIWGKMPLKYSYGKMSRGVGEQALCVKGGSLVPCDDG